MHARIDASAEQLLVQARERFGLRDYHGTIHILEEVVEQGRPFADVHQLLGVSYSLLNRPAEALACFDRALELNPRYTEALIHRGLVLNELGRTDDAQESFRLAAAAELPMMGGFPGTVAARLANLHATLGDAYEEAGGLSEAVQQYERALALAPTFHDLRFRHARLLLEAGRVLEAREALETVLAVRPDFLDAQAALGLAHYLSGDAGGARAVWTASLARRPDSSRIEAYLAMVARAGA